MAVTANLGITTIDSGQSQKEVTANAATTAFDTSQGLVSVSIAGAVGTQTLTAANLRCSILIFTGVITGNRAIEFPNAGFDGSAVGPRHWIIFNNTTGAFTVTVRRTGQTGFVIATAKHAIGYYNGTDIVRVTADT
jgi:hypothetical protein